MDPIKQRVLELIGSDRIRRRRHFDEQAAARDVILDEAIQAVVSGTLIQGDADHDVRFGERYRIRGRDHSGRMLDVIVSLDDQQEVLWLHTVFAASGRGAKRR